MQARRIESIDFLRGLAMIVMALDHVRMYFGYGTWYAQPTDLATTTPLLFFTRWITHFCAPVFVFLAGLSAALYRIRVRQGDARATAAFLLKRGLWLILVELLIVNLAWTFDITYSFVILQVIWAIGVSMLVLSALVFLPGPIILAAGVLLVGGHNLLDSITARGDSAGALLWYALHQPETLFVDGRLINVVYPVLPWLGLTAIGYAAGSLYREVVPAGYRRNWLVWAGIGASALFLVLRGLHLYGEPHDWGDQGSPLFDVMSFLNTTKYPPSVHFLLMAMGPALLLLAALEAVPRLPQPVLVFGRVPLFFYMIHLYLIHALAMLMLVYRGGEAQEYILSASAITSGRLRDAGLSLAAVYVIWILVVGALYPLCHWYQRVRGGYAWLRYL